MPFFAISKYEKKHRLESLRENLIQNIQATRKCSREYAVRYYDYAKQYYSHQAIGVVAGGLYVVVAHKILKSPVLSKPIYFKPFVYYPLMLGAFSLGKVLYDKLSNHYLNWDDYESAFSWEKDYAARFRVHSDEELENWQKTLSLTPYERIRQQTILQLNKAGVEGEKVFRRLSKDRNDFYYLYGKIRNLENIAYLSDEEIQKITSPVELQMKIDSINPTRPKQEDLNQVVEGFHKELENYKNKTENSKNFRSVKEKFLGLPFMMLRHRQHPEPAVGTWQYEAYQRLFNEEYDANTSYETEEKINKYNYHQFLHPSVIAKYDTNSEEFEMFLRKLNFESKTRKEASSARREYYCKKMMPLLNQTGNNPDLGYDIIHYVSNKERHLDDEFNYNNFYYDQYSNQKEEKLFREAEEAKFLNKNSPSVQRVQYSTILKDRIGIKPEEMETLLNNPTKAKAMRRALEQKYPYVESFSHHDKLKSHQKRAIAVDLLVENEVDPFDPGFDFLNDVYDKMYSTGTENEEKNFNYMHWLHWKGPISPGDADYNTYPNDSFNLNYFYYSSDIDFNDYRRDYFPRGDMISPKNHRYELYTRTQWRQEYSKYGRMYNSFKQGLEYISIVNPDDAKYDDELKERIFKSSPFERNLKLHNNTDHEKEARNFLEERTESDSYDIVDDLTEEDLDQALFEASYVKPVHDSEEYKGN